MSENKQTTDSELLLQIVGYNQNAFEELYNRYSATIYSLIKEIVTNPKLAEKILLNVFSVFLKRIDHYSTNSNNIFTWLTLLARNISIDTLKRMKFVEDIPIYSDDYEIEFILPNLSQEISLINLCEREELSEKIKSYKNHLTEVQNLVLSLIYFEGLNEEEIAKRLNVPSATVRQKTLGIMENLHQQYTGRSEAPNNNKELLSLIKLESLGYISSEERMIFNQLRHNDPDFLWKEYGEYQNLTALLSTAITLTKPTHELNTELRTVFTKILQGSDVDYPMIASEIPIVETIITPLPEPASEKNIVPEVKAKEEIKEQTKEQKDAGFHIKFRERDPNELSLLRKLETVEVKPAAAPIPVYAKVEKEIQFRDNRVPVKKPSVLTERKEAVLDSKEIIKAVITDEKTIQDKIPASQTKAEIKIENDDPLILIEEPKPIMVKEEIPVKNRLIPNSSINLKELFKKENNPVNAKSVTEVQNKTVAPAIENSDIKLKTNVPPKEFQKSDSFVTKEDKTILSKPVMPVAETSDIKIKSNEVPKEFRSRNVFVDKEVNPFEQKSNVSPVGKSITTVLKEEKITPNKPSEPIVEKSDIKIKTNEPPKELRTSSIFVDKNTNTIQAKHTVPVNDKPEIKTQKNEAPKEIQKVNPEVAKTQTTEPANKQASTVEIPDTKIKTSELSKEIKKVIVSAAKNEIQNQNTTTAPIADKSEIKLKTTETSKAKDQLKPDTKAVENSFERIKPSVDKTNLKIRETIFAESDKKPNTIKQAISTPVKESKIEKEVVHSVSAITESINIEEILTKIEDQKSDTEVISESETYEREIIKLQKRLRRNILVSAALFIIIVSSSVFFYFQFQETPTEVADKKNNSEKLILAEQTNLVVNNDYKATTENVNPEKLNETPALKENVVDGQVAAITPTEVSAKEENKILTPSIIKNLTSIDDTEPTQIAAAKTDNIVIPKENKKVEEEPSVFLAVEEMPELVGGIKGLQNKIVYPKIAEQTNTEGKVLVQAVVDENGKVISTNVIKGIGAGCDEVALDAVINSKFKPGKQRGKNVKVQVTIPIVFKKQ